MSRKKQILIFGDAFDKVAPLNEVIKLARRIGNLLAKNGAILMYGGEPDVKSIPTEAAKAAKAAGGITVAFPPNSSKELFEPEAATIVCPLSGDRGGPREAFLSRMGDKAIVIGGGSGTATEALSAYQAEIPIICLKGSGGWADRLLESPIDKRAEFRQVLSAETAEEAVALALS